MPNRKNMRFPTYHHPLTGIVVPVSAVISRSSCGIGEFDDLRLLAQWCKNAAIDTIQILPVNDTGQLASPYSAISAYALHPVYIRLDRLPGSGAVTKDIETLRERYNSRERICFHDVAQRKSQLLYDIYSHNRDAFSEDRELITWTEQNPWVRPYSVYKLLKHRNRLSPWNEWTEYQHPTAHDIDMLWDTYRQELLFYCWVQYHLERQLVQTVTAIQEMGITLKGDIPILMQVDSADVWLSRQYFSPSFRAGAPPDMFSEDGQNWGFPIYNWQEMEKNDFLWWKRRLRQAAKFYHAYRIDHVLGFFRIWAIPEMESSGLLGHFDPSRLITKSELIDAGFDNARITWLTRPHIPKHEIDAALGSSAEDVQPHLEQIGDEALYRIPVSIKGSNHIEQIPTTAAVKEALKQWNKDRTLLRISEDRYAPRWNYHQTRGYESLCDKEKQAFERLREKTDRESERQWEQRGRHLLSFMKFTTDMLVCAEDLGVVPRCVPNVLDELDILGLNIIFWTRYYQKPGAPFIPVEDYPRKSVAMLSGHDTPTMRQWWEELSDRTERQALCTTLRIRPQLTEASYTPQTASLIVERFLRTSSLLCMFQLQELFALTETYRSSKPADERINVPGTQDEKNWSYRLPVPVEDLLNDEDFSRIVASAVQQRRQMSSELPTADASGKQQSRSLLSTEKPEKEN